MPQAVYTDKDKLFLPLMMQFGKADDELS